MTKKLLATILVFTLVYFSFPLQAKAYEYTREEKLIKLRLVFERYSSPFLGMEETFLEVAESTGLDWTLLPAISGTESSFAKRMPCSNPYGWGITGNKRICFSNLEEATHVVGNSLSQKYNTDSLYSIAKKYNPGNTAHWLKKTTFFMNRIKNQSVPVSTLPIEL